MNHKVRYTAPADPRIFARGLETLQDAALDLNEASFDLRCDHMCRISKTATVVLKFNESFSNGECPRGPGPSPSDEEGFKTHNLGEYRRLWLPLWFLSVRGASR
ncbi:MAG: hypothetical protein Q9192_001917 [Flavoplaca navasiana]